MSARPEVWKKSRRRVKGSSPPRRVIRVEIWWGTMLGVLLVGWEE